MKKRHLHARIVDLVNPSPDRCIPPCSYFTAGCGGCQWQHVNCNTQLAAKGQVLIETLNRIGKLLSLPDVTLHTALQPLAYRNNIRLTIASSRPQIVFGFKAEKSHRVIPIDRCEIALPAINRALPQVADLITRFRLFQVDAVTVRASATTDEVMLTLIYPRRHKSRLNLTDEDLRNYPTIHALFAKIGERGVAEWIAGKQTITETVGGMAYEIGPDTFFQNNLAGLEQLIGIVRGRVREIAPSFAIDAHCGVGAFTLPTAQTAQSVLGVDLQGEAIGLARRNTEINGIINVTFRVGNLAKLSKISADLVLLDPPRDGCWSEDLEVLERIAPQHILYISCNPATLARDLSRLKIDYEIGTLDLVDLFPMTYHFETVVWLERRK